jgi:hypothetical protein
MAQTPAFSRLLARLSDTATYLDAVDSLDGGEFEDLDERLHNARWIDDLLDSDRSFVNRCISDMEDGRDGRWYEANGWRPADT